MNLKDAIELTGAVQIGIAVSNLPLARILRYREHLLPVPPIIRQIFTIHAFYIVLTLLGFALISLFFAEDLCGRSSLGTFLSGFLAVFWLLRVGIQLCYYDRAIKKQYRWGNVLFTAAFIYLGAVYFTAVFAKP